MKNAQVLPYFGDASDQNSNLSSKDKFQLAVTRNRSKNGDLQPGSQNKSKGDQYGSEFVSELQVMNRGKVKSNTVLEEFRQKRLKSMNIKGEVDMKDILRKARQRSEKQNAYIAINHLSPNRYLRHFKESEDLRNLDAQN